MKDVEGKVNCHISFWSWRRHLYGNRKEVTGFGLEELGLLIVNLLTLCTFEYAFLFQYGQYALVIPCTDN